MKFTTLREERIPTGSGFGVRPSNHSPTLLGCLDSRIIPWAVKIPVLFGTGKETKNYFGMTCDICLSFVLFVNTTEIANTLIILRHK